MIWTVFAKDTFYHSYGLYSSMYASVWMIWLIVAIYTVYYLVKVLGP